MTNGFLTRKWLRPWLEIFRQGVSPKKLALSVALGVVIGVIPLPGWSTALCALVSLIWGLNVPAIQLVNYLLYPVQLALLIPFFRLGETLFGAPHLPLSVSKIYGFAHANLWEGIRLLWITTWHGFVVWALMAPFIAGLLYFLLEPAFRRVLQHVRSALPATNVHAAG